jgi:hypothetical protein
MNAVRALIDENVHRSVICDIRSVLCHLLDDQRITHDKADGPRCVRA